MPDANGIASILSGFLDEGPAVQARTAERKLRTANLQNVASQIRSREDASTRADKQIVLGQERQALNEAKFDAEQARIAKIGTATQTFSRRLAAGDDPLVALSELDPEVIGDPQVARVFTAATSLSRFQTSQAATQGRFETGQTRVNLANAARRADATDTQVNRTISRITAARSNFSLSPEDRNIRSMIDNGQVVQARAELRQRVNPSFDEDNQAREQLRSLGQQGAPELEAPDGAAKTELTSQEDFEGIIQDSMENGLGFAEAIQEARESFTLGENVKVPIESDFRRRTGLRRNRNR